MESGHQEDSSSEEVDQPEQDTNEVGVGRSYECVFCKRGFTTAQALGGHMNIHRKDRAKNNRPHHHHNHRALINSDKHRENNYTSPKIYSPPPRYFPAHHEEQVVSYRTYFPDSTSSGLGLIPSCGHQGNDFCGRREINPGRLSPFGDDWRVSLSLRFGEDDEPEEKNISGSEEDELDLELRLGHNP